MLVLEQPGEKGRRYEKQRAGNPLGYQLVRTE